MSDSPESRRDAAGADAAQRRLDERLQRLEENAGFAEHTVEQLGQSMVDLSSRLERALARIAALEKRLDRHENPPAAPPGANEAPE